MIVEASMNAVETHSIWSTPSSSPTMVGSAVASTVWLSENMNIAIIRPTKSRMIAEVVIGAVCSSGPAVAEFFEVVAGIVVTSVSWLLLITAFVIAVGPIPCGTGSGSLRRSLWFRLCARPNPDWL